MPVFLKREHPVVGFKLFAYFTILNIEFWFTIRFYHEISKLILGTFYDTVTDFLLKRTHAINDSNNLDEYFLWNNSTIKLINLDKTPDMVWEDVINNHNDHCVNPYVDLNFASSREN